MTTPWMKDVRLPCNSVGDPAPAVKWTKDRCVRDPGGMGDPRHGCSRGAMKKRSGYPSFQLTRGPAEYMAPALPCRPGLPGSPLLAAKGA